MAAPVLRGPPPAPPELRLRPRAWDTADDRLSFVALGDNGSGGRQALAVAERMAQLYRATPCSLVALLGDICYYGNFRQRFDTVFRRPLGPLIDAGVGFELAIGNHDTTLDFSDDSYDAIEAELELLGTPGRYYTTTHGPVDFFYLDSSFPGVYGASGLDQLTWLDDALAASDNQWKVVALHHPPYSSGVHGSTPGARERLAPPRPPPSRPRAHRPRPPLRAGRAAGRGDVRGQRGWVQDHEGGTQRVHRRGRADAPVPPRRRRRRPADRPVRPPRRLAGRPVRPPGAEGR